MHGSGESFVHILLFRCLDCGGPISWAVSATERNLERTDALSFVMRCACGWSGSQNGLHAKRHWVESWD